MDGLKKIAEAYGISNGIIKENVYSFSIVCDKDKLKGNSILSIPTDFKLPDKDGKIQNQFSYLLPKNAKTNKIDYKTIYDANLLNNLKNNGTNFIIGFDLQTGEPIYANMEDLTNVGVVGAQGSGKSVVLFNLVYQFYHKDFIEFIIVDKGDLSLLNELPKVVSAINIENGDVMESFFPFLNYLIIENIKRKNIFAKYNKTHGIANYYQYMEAIFNGKITNGKPMNQIFCILDEFNTWRERISTSLGDKEGKIFDDSIAVIINTMRSVGINLIPSAQTFYSGDLGTIRKGGIKKWIVGNAKNVEELIGEGGKEHKNNLLNNIQGSYCFFDSGTQKYLKIPYISSSKELVDVLTTLSLNEKYESNKAKDIVETLNKNILKNKDESVVFGKLDEILEYFGINKTIEEFSEKLGYRFIGYSILLWKIKYLIENDAISNSIKLLGDFTFPKKNNSSEDIDLDTLLYTNVKIFNNETKMIVDLEKSLIDYQKKESKDERKEIINSIGIIIIKNIKQKGLSL